MDSNKLYVPRILLKIKFFGLSIDLSTWVSAAKLKIPFNSIDQMAAAIDDILLMPEDRIKKIGKKYRTFVEENFTNQNMVNQTLNLYNKILNKN